MFRITHMHLRSHDPRKAARWYVELLGARVVSETEGPGGFLSVHFDIGEVRFHMSSPRPEEDLMEGTSQAHFGLDHFGLHTDDVKETIASFEARGVKVLDGPTLMTSGNTIACMEGPDNVRIELVQPGS